MQHLPKVYIAGPDVFSPEWSKFATDVKNLCLKRQLEPLFPDPVDFDPCAPDIPGLTVKGTPEQATAIFKTCVELIQQADFIAANISLFRGPAVDSGTAFEMGYAFALGKPIVVYTKSINIPENHDDMKRLRTKHGAYLCRNGYVVERFGLAANVMVDRACQTVYSGTIQQALDHIARLAKNRDKKHSTEEYAR